MLEMVIFNKGILCWYFVHNIVQSLMLLYYLYLTKNQSNSTIFGQFQCVQKLSKYYYQFYHQLECFQTKTQLLRFTPLFALSYGRFVKVFKKGSQSAINPTRNEQLSHYSSSICMFNHCIISPPHQRNIQQIEIHQKL